MSGVLSWSLLTPVFLLSVLESSQNSIVGRWSGERSVDEYSRLLSGLFGDLLVGLVFVDALLDLVDGGLLRGED
jgi:hypothetical protein